MKRIAMFMCVVLAIGWISDAGIVTLKYDNGIQIKGIPVRAGYETEITYAGVTTSLCDGSQNLQYKLFNSAFIYVNHQWVRCTRLGNGWLFKFNQQESNNASGLPNR